MRFRHLPVLNLLLSNHRTKLSIAFCVLLLHLPILIQSLSLIVTEFAHLVLLSFQSRHLFVQTSDLILDLTHREVTCVAHLILHILLLLRCKHQASNLAQTFLSFV